MGLIDKMKNDIKKSGTNKGKFTYFREGQKQRVRFLCDLDDGIEVVFHDSFEQNVNVPCQEQYGRGCDYCESEGLRTRSQYAWPVYNFDAKEVQVFMFPVNNCSPVPALVACNENFGTIMDRDYVISVSGKGNNKTYSVIPMDKVKFRNDKAKAFSEKMILKMIDKAWPADNGDEEEDEDEAPKKKSKTKNVAQPKSKSKTKKPIDDDDDDEYDDDQDFDDDDDDDKKVDYDDMSTKELYKLCRERKIDVEPRKSDKYYIKQLEAYDEAHDEWGDDDDEWEGED